MLAVMKRRRLALLLGRAVHLAAELEGDLGVLQQVLAGARLLAHRRR